MPKPSVPSSVMNVRRRVAQRRKEQAERARHKQAAQTKPKKPVKSVKSSKPTGSKKPKKVSRKDQAVQQSRSVPSRRSSRKSLSLSDKLGIPFEIPSDLSELTRDQLALIHQQCGNFLQARMKANPLRYFVPNGAQEKRILAESVVNVFSAGNGIGKTYLLANIAGNLALGPQSRFFQCEPYLSNPIPSQGRIVSTPTNIEKTIIPTLKTFLPPGSYKTRKGSKLFESIWELSNGTTFDIMTYEQEPKEFEGATLHWVLCDEPPPESIYGSLISRFRKGGTMFIFMTPLTGAGWIFDKLDNPWATEEASWSIVWGNIEDNCKEHGKNGTLEHRDIERMIAEYPPDEREARISGKPLYREGRIYPVFNRDVHVVPAEIIQAKLAGPHLKYHIVDPHDRKPFAMIWGLIDPTGDLYVYDEWPNEPFNNLRVSMNTKQYADLIRSKENGAIIWERIIDARYGNRKVVQTGSTIRDEFDEESLAFSNSYTDDHASISSGHLKVREYLHYDTAQPLSACNRPKLYIASHCLNTIYGFQNYVYDDFRRKEMGQKEKPKEVNKDFMDCIRYWIMDEPEFIEIPEQASEPAPWIDMNAVPDRWQPEEVGVGYGY